MATRRRRVALLAIPICTAAVLLINAERSHPANAGGPIDPTCTSSSPCIEYDNNSTGQGVKGFSHQGNGLTGWTGWNSTSNANSKYGVVGNDQSTSGSFDGGVLGKSVRGTGTSGASTSGTGVTGLSSTGFGVIGTTNGVQSSIAGVEGIGNGTSTGVLALGSKLLFVGSDMSGNLVYVVDAAGNVIESQVNAFGTVSSFSKDSFALLGDAESSTTDAVRALGIGGLLFNAYNSKGQQVFFVTDDGNVGITGGYYKDGECITGCSAATAASPGRAVRSYSTQASSPTIEDFGEATLTNGAGYVRMDPSFANVIEQQSNYLVFITPEGDSRGLYVTQKSLRGFVVRESQGGHSTLAFSYRIVAKPLRDRSPRLPMVAVRMTLRQSPKPRGIH